MDDSREYPVRPICAVGAVVRDRDKVLLIRRGRPPRLNEWSIPGGAVELGETLQEAVQREVQEECGLQVAVGEIVAAIDIIERDDAGRVQFHYVILDFAATRLAGDLAATSDAAEARWVPGSELDRYPLNARTREVLDKALRASEKR